MFRLTSLVTEFVREIYPPEPNLPTGRDSAETTLSNINATACLNVAAAVLVKIQKEYKLSESR